MWNTNLWLPKAWGRGAPSKTRMGCSGDRKSTRLNSSHSQISYAVFCLKNKNSYNTDELLPVFETIQALKRPGRFPVAHHGDSLTEMLRHLQGGRETIPCLGVPEYMCPH